jgi:uroporphyrinogen decarboxylase
MTVPLLVRAARREPVERTPVWFMRQAGRSLPEYRALRERHSFWKLARTPELCAEITLQPVRRHDVDAAVIFADIMTPVLALGVDVELVEGVGPVVDPPLTDASELRIPEEVAPEVAAAIRIVRDELNDEVAVIGFCGGPFTVAGYLVEGRPSRDFTTVKSFIHSEPDAWHALMDVLADCFARYVREQAAAGADVIQLFDSWAGVLSPRDYREHVVPYSARVLDAVDVPTIHFGTGTAGLLGDFAAAGGDVIGLDWRIELDRGWDEVGDDRGVQGNLDPTVLLAPWEEIETAALDVLERARGRTGHIFNLGHGVLPRTNPDVLSRLRELVHQRTVEARV